MRSAPSWIVVLEASDAWGQPPWLWAGGKAIIWYLRYEARRTAQIEAEAIKKQRAETEAWLRGLG